MYLKINAKSFYGTKDTVIEILAVKNNSCKLFYMQIKYYYKATFYFTLNNYATLQDDGMGAKINVNTKAIT